MTGSILGTVSQSGGVIHPGGYGIGQLTVTTYNQQSKGDLEIDTYGANSGQYDILVVTGTATVSGKVTIDTLSSSSNGDTYQVLVAGALTGNAYY